MNAQCILELFKEKGYIRIEKHNRTNNLNIPPYYIVRVQVTSNIIPQLVEEIQKDTQYLCYHYKRHDYFCYTKKEDIKEFLKHLTTLNKEKIYLGYGSFTYLEKYEQEWINENTEFWCEDGRNLINKELRGKRMHEEAEKNKNAIELLNALSNNIPDELIFSDIKMKYDYDYTYDSDDGHPVLEHEEIVPSFKNMIEIFSDLYDHDLAYCSNFGPNREYLEKSLKEIKRMEAMKEEIENEYGNKVKCILSDWNEGCQFGCVLYVYIL